MAASTGASNKSRREEWAYEKLVPLLEPLVMACLKETPEDTKIFMSKWLADRKAGKSPAARASQEDAEEIQEIRRVTRKSLTEAFSPPSRTSGGLPLRPMGSQGLACSMQGYGCMGLTAFYGAALPEEQGVAVLEKAYSLGVTHFDTAEMYAGKNAAGEDKHNEALVGQFLKKVGRGDVTFATKYFPAGEKAACTEEQVRTSLDASLARLQEPSVDLYYLHRIPSMDGLKSFMEASKKLVAEGKIKYVGISEATADEIRAAHAIHPLTAVQMEYSLVVRNIEKEIKPLCRELGIAIVAYSPLARGLTSATVKKQEDWSKIGHEGGAGSGFQTKCPYLTGDNLDKNVKLLEPLEEEAGKLGVTPAELSLAWLHAHGGEMVFPIPGTTKVANLEKNVNGASIALMLSGDVVAKIGGPTASGDALSGDRYPEGFQSMSFDGRSA